MKVHCDEGVATHIGPEPCAGVREDVGEASAGEHIGQPLSRETVVIPGADAVYSSEGKMDGRANASAWPTRRGLRPLTECGPAFADTSQSIEARKVMRAGGLHPPQLKTGPS